jgi:hypothetical protein
MIREATTKDDLQKLTDKEIVLLATREAAIIMIVIWRAIQDQILTLMQKPRQVTGATFTGVLIKNGIAISMDGKGAPGGTTSSSRGCDAASNMRKCICGPTAPCPRRLHRSAASSTSARRFELSRHQARSRLLHRRDVLLTIRISRSSPSM